MAVYTSVSDRQLSVFLEAYNVGAPLSCKGIAEGVENTNYLVATQNGRFILTLYEKRVRLDDLPFFLGLMGHLVKKGLPTAAPVPTRDGATLRELNGRPAALIEFLDGVSRDAPSVEDCAALGTMLARLHLAAADFDGTRPNNLGLDGWQRLARDCADFANPLEDGLLAFIGEELAALTSAWPRAVDDLPCGIIHADLFPDNVLFTGQQITGLIDFYFSCTDVLAYDLAVCFNSWCFGETNSFLPDHARAMISAYEAQRPLGPAERVALPLLCRGAALRFLLTRLYDWGTQTPGALVRVKDPLEYRAKAAFFRTDALRDILA